MKKIILLLVLSVSSYGFGQDTEFKFSKEGFTVPGHFNNLNLDLKNYLASDSSPSKKSDW
jgi:hypothetical protein